MHMVTFIQFILGVKIWIHTHTYTDTFSIVITDKVVSLQVFPGNLSEQAVQQPATIWPCPLQVDLWPFDPESGVRVTCDVGYLCANFSLPSPLCSWLRPDVYNRCQTDVRRASSLNAPDMGVGH